MINAGDGKHEHPSQALLDVYTLLERFGSLEGKRRDDLEGKRIWIVGDVLHSRVARSCALCFRMMGAEVTRLRAADPDPARDRARRSASTSPTRSTTSARPTSSTRCGCSASG